MGENRKELEAPRASPFQQEFSDIKQLHHLENSLTDFKFPFYSTALALPTNQHRESLPRLCATTTIPNTTSTQQEACFAFTILKFPW
jgi:hypothetical protein